MSSSIEDKLDEELQPGVSSPISSKKLEEYFGTKYPLEGTFWAKILKEI